jgi:Tfp pilus assembly protein PilN
MINLLPPEIKQQRKYSKYNRILIQSIFGLVILALITAAAFYTSWLILKNNEQHLTQSVERENDKTREYGAIENQAKALADRLATIENIQSARSHYPALLQALAEATPQDAYITSFTLDPSAKTMNLSAYAKTDQAVASFKNSLESSSRFSSAAIQSMEPASDPYSGATTNRVTYLVGLQEGALK